MHYETNRKTRERKVEERNGETEHADDEEEDEKIMNNRNYADDEDDYDDDDDEEAHHCNDRTNSTSDDYKQSHTNTCDANANKNIMKRIQR